MRKNQTKLKLLGFALCLPFALAGCGLTKGNDADGGSPLEFTDMLSGFMVSVGSLAQQGELLTSTRFGDETCAAFYLEFDADGIEEGVGEFGCAFSGEEYFFLDGTVNLHTDRKDDEIITTYFAECTVYLNAEKTENALISFDSLFRGEDGTLIREPETPFLTENNIAHAVDSDLKQTISMQEEADGETITITHTIILKCKLNLVCREIGTDWRILQFAEDGSLLSRTAVDKDDAGDFAISDRCAFVVAEENTENGVARTLYRTDETVRFMCDGGFGLLKGAEFYLQRANA